MEKTVIDIIMNEKDIKALDDIKTDNERLRRLKNVLLLFIKQSKLNLNKGLTKQNIEYATHKFDEYFATNPILTQYVNDGILDISYVEKQLEYFYNSVLKDLGIVVENKVAADIQNIFENVNDSGETKGKKMVKSNGLSLLEDDAKSKGYVEAILMAILAASIEISTVAYILFNGM